MSTQQALPDGYTVVPPGKIASVVTFLEMRRKPTLTARPAVGVQLVRLGPVDVARYKRIYRQIGERWFWFSRLSIADGDLAAILASPGVEAYAATRDGVDLGLLELDLTQPGEAEIVYFGLVDSAVGQGVGGWMMREALAIAWARPIGRCWLHTCTLDHPGAVGFYRRFGFAPFKLAVEIADDPRLTGALDPGAFPEIPLVRP
ncbi:N-acetyltransferase [Alsobacter metallidurans]|uniref:N-acetyltransferase n=1 Tax=Alsobacter metallidurans TaxID=340221 RepID=A0A917MJV3_9HYPH|nr:GNAT family N-acetyltransferase [Alsobacter metallidurans]GGH29162.1 N-acetyltransferase [Alsobacter metallidurans]